MKTEFERGHEHLFQDDDYMCLPAVIQMILTKSGINLSQERIAKYTHNGQVLADENGAYYEVALSFLKNIYADVRLIDETNYENLNDLKSRDLEIIAEVQSHEEDDDGGISIESHYVRLGEMDLESIDIFDPSYGERPDGNCEVYTLSREDFEVIWEKWCMVLDPASKKENVLI